MRRHNVQIEPSQGNAFRGCQYQGAYLYPEYHIIRQCESLNEYKRLLKIIPTNIQRYAEIILMTVDISSACGARFSEQSELRATLLHAVEAMAFAFQWYLPHYIVAVT